MRRLPFFLLAACLIALGCNSTGKKPPAPTNNQSGKDNSVPFWSEDRPANATGVKGPPPPQADGMLAGSLIDSSGRPQPNAVVNVTAADAGPNAKPVGVQADGQGYFIIKGLTVGTTYLLSVRGDNGGRVVGGSTLTQAPNVRLVIPLREGNFAPLTPVQSPPAATSPAATDKKEGKPKLADPATSNIPNPEPVPASRDPLTGSDQSWGPGKMPPATKPLPLPPPPATSSPNIADSDAKPWRPPTVTIPNPNATAPVVEPPPPSASPSMSAVPSNSSPLTGAPITQMQPQGQRVSFTLYDAAGNGSDFSKVSDRRLVVLDFWATTCAPCLQKIPSLIDLQARYGNYVDIVAITCDNQSWAERTRAAEGIRDYYLRKLQKPINYQMWFEGDGQEGRVQAQFNVKSWPTMILVDHAGRELWRGSDVRQLDESIKYYLMRK